MRFLRHAGVVTAALLLLLGVPALLLTDVAALLGGVDAVTRASMELPAQPSGEFIVLLNASLHPGTLEQWRVFFEGGDAGVIMSDVSCLTADGDASGAQLAERYRARLPENQMRLRRENAALLASKVESGAFDAAVFSREMAELCGLETDVDGAITVLVKGE